MSTFSGNFYKRRIKTSFLDSEGGEKPNLIHGAVETLQGQRV